MHLKRFQSSVTKIVQRTVDECSVNVLVRGFIPFHSEREGSDLRIFFNALELTF